jgi:hypothetical protein
MVRAAAYEAIAKSRNNSHHRVLLRALHDRESFVSEQAAKAIAGKPNVIEVIATELNGWFANGAPRPRFGPSYES